MRNKLLPIVSISLASVVLLSGCSSSDKLSDGKWSKFDSSGQEVILKVDGDDFSLKSYDDDDLEAKLAGKINRPKRAFLIHKQDWGDGRAFSLSTQEKKSMTKDDVIEYRFEGKSLILKGENNEELTLTKE